MNNPPSAIELNPSRFYSLVELIKDQAKESNLEVIRETKKGLDTLLESLDERAEQLVKAETALLHEARLSTRREKAFGSSLEQEDLFKETKSYRSFIRIATEMARAFQDNFRQIREVLARLEPGVLILSGKRFDSSAPDSFEALQHMTYEIQMNRPTLDSYLTGLTSARMLKANVLGLGLSIAGYLDEYYQALVDRHSVQGVKVHRDPVATDIAIAIFENVDAHGEIDSGKKVGELTAYSMRKAIILAEALKHGFVFELIENPQSFILFIDECLTSLWNTSCAINDFLQGAFEKLDKISGSYTSSSMKYRAKASKADFDALLTRIEDLDPSTVPFKEKQVLLTKEERFNADFRNETLENVVEFLTNMATPDELIQYVLARKEQLREYFQNENSFYTCKISSGNPFLGEAPGALTVIPAQRPYANLDEILGSGFDEIKNFISSVEASAKWHDLFLATSPSKTADKNNVLLVGPQGCGKSEILRAVGADTGSISVFAQGSDFLTCWKGEAEKNPKRLFEEGLKLQKQSGRHIHFLIDEIDAVLNNDRDHTSTNLTLEFQILMDGVVHYPNLSVWGATNHFERIPMPMIRRFNKVAIVGELSPTDRVSLLKHFVSFLPTRGFGHNGDSKWPALAHRLEGATGDVIRKIADHLWKEKMTQFVRKHSEEAEKVVKWLNDPSTNEGHSFQLSTFSKERRAELNARLEPFIHVTPQDLDATISAHLNNQAIYHEIATAVKTYARARDFLSKVQSAQVTSKEEARPQ